MTWLNGPLLGLDADMPDPTDTRDPWADQQAAGR